MRTFAKPALKFCLGLGVIIILTTSCSRPPANDAHIAEDTYVDTSALGGEPVEEETQEAYNEEVQEKHDVMDYAGPDEERRAALQTFQPFADLSAIVTNFIRQKDSLRDAGADAFAEHERRTYEAVLHYKRQMENGNFSVKDATTLLDMPRSVGAGDSTYNSLPAAGKTSFFRNNNFFFLGGTPFVQKMINYDSITYQEKIFTDANGNPELRFQVLDTENVYYIFKSLMQYRKPSMRITFGPPVEAYDAPPDEVKNIGSVVHHFEDDVHVLFLTENGLAPGRLCYYQVPFTEQYRCYSGYPKLVFSCSASIDASGILGIYLPYDDQSPSSCQVNRENKWLWTADLNSDGVADMACAVATFEGVQSDALLELLWFVNVNGEWKIIDYGSEPSCT
jgi:hypothetical protein